MIGDRLKQLRHRKGILQVDLAKQLNVSKGAVAMWETNKREPDTSMLKRIANYFNVSLDYLLENEANNISETNYNDNDLKFALFGDIKVDDEVLDEVRHYAKIAKQMREENKRKYKITHSKNDDEIDVFIAAHSEGNTEIPHREKMSKAEWERLKSLPQTDDDF